MRKKLSIMLAAITVLALISAGPVVAQTVPPNPCETDPEIDCVTVCFTQDDVRLSFGEPFNAGTTARVPADLAADLITDDIFEGGPFARLGPCGDGGGGGGNGGGAGGGGDGAAAAPLELTQETEQEAESGDVDQSFDVSQTGDNSNQCASPQGVANTGNPQNVIDLLQAGSEADDFEFEEVGSDITV